MKFVAVFETATDGGVAVWVDGIAGAYGFGDTEEEALDHLTEVLHGQAEFHKGNLGYFPEWYKEGEKIHYTRRYCIMDFFARYPFFNVSKLAEAIGVNRSLLRRYKEGISHPTRRQHDKIQEEFSKLFAPLSSVRI